MFKPKSATREKTAETVSMIGKGMLITGNIETSGDIRIDGILKGNLRCSAKILIGPDGIVEGDIDGKQADVMGTVIGHVSMSGLLYLHGQAKVDGDIHAAQLQIDPTVSFNGQCKMGAQVVELGQPMALAVNE